MPIYGYECNACGHQFELFRGINDPPLEECPECGGKVRKLLYPVGVIFKGSGFYTTDYKGSGKSTGNGSGSSEKSSSDQSGGGGSSSGSESKPSSGESKSPAKSDSSSSD